MRKDVAATLAEHEDAFLRQLRQIGPVVLETLRKAELEVSSIKRGRGHDAEAPWLLSVRPAEHIAQAFELAPELLVLLIPGTRARARDVEQAEAALTKGLRLDRSLVLVISSDPDARDCLDHVVRVTKRQYLFITIDEVYELEDPQQWFRRFLREQLASANLFAPGPPVVGWDFFGRTEELERLRKLIIAGRPVGLYGLRKIGKTSLALNELDRLMAEARKRESSGRRGEETIALHIDMQALGLEQNIAGFMRALVRAMFEGMERAEVLPRALNVDPKWGRVKELRKASSGRVTRLGQELIELAVEWSRRGPSRRVVIFIDEYERLFEREIFPLRDSLLILDYLRGLVQRNPRSFNFIIAGLTRRYASQSNIGSRQNPLFDFVVDFPLKGLRPDELRALFRRIGGRLGLDFDSSAIHEIWEQTGGHPALARHYGRVIDLHVSRHARIAGAQVGRVMVVDCYDEYARAVETSMQEIERAIKSMDRRCPDVLRDLMANPGPSGLGLASLSADVVDQLHKLGILERDADGQGWTIAMKSFGTWLMANYPGTQPASLTG